MLYMCSKAFERHEQLAGCCGHPTHHGAPQEAMAPRYVFRSEKNRENKQASYKRSMSTEKISEFWSYLGSLSHQAIPKKCGRGEQLKPKWAERIGKQDGICLSFSMLEIPADSCRHSWQLAAWRKSLGPPWMRLSLAAESCQKSFICD